MRWPSRQQQILAHAHPCQRHTRRAGQGSSSSHLENEDAADQQRNARHDHIVVLGDPGLDPAGTAAMHMRSSISSGAQGCCLLSGRRVSRRYASKPEQLPRPAALPRLRLGSSTPHAARTQAGHTQAITTSSTAKLKPTPADLPERDAGADEAHAQHHRGADIHVDHGPGAGCCHTPPQPAAGWRSQAAAQRRRVRRAQLDGQCGAGAPGRRRWRWAASQQALGPGCPTSKPHSAAAVGRGDSAGAERRCQRSGCRLHRSQAPLHAACGWEDLCKCSRGSGAEGNEASGCARGG